MVSSFVPSKRLAQRNELTYNKIIIVLYKEDYIMKYYNITVNGNTYEVSVEETSSSSPLTTNAPAPVAAAKNSVSPVAKPTTAPVASATGSIKVNSPMPGKILAIKANPGQSVMKGDVILILEAMKMENEIVAPQDGTVSSVNATTGQTVEAGEILATLN